MSDSVHENKQYKQKYTRHRQKEKERFGRDGFKVNEAWETVWKNTPPSRPSEVLSEEIDDDKYAPFAEWSGPSSESANKKPPKKIHRDASHVPFERPPREAREDPHADLAGTTITPSEKKAFESLFELGKPSAAPEADSTTNSRRKGLSKDGVDNMLETTVRKVLSKKGEAATYPYRTPPELPAPLKKLRQAAMAPRVENTPSKIGKERLEQTHVRSGLKHITSKKHIGDSWSERLDRLAEQDVFDTKKTMLALTTDTKIWALLQSKVLNSVLSLELDGSLGAKSKRWKVSEALTKQDDLEDTDSMPEKNATHGEASQLPDTRLHPMGHSNAISSDGNANESTTTHSQPPTGSVEDRTLQLLSRSAPQHLINAFTILTDRFPASPLPLNLIPLVKSLGPSTAALCLSTRLYNLHIQHHWDKYRDPLAICDILREMDDNVYEFDDFTGILTGNILHNVRAAGRGELGVAAQAIASMDRAVQGQGVLHRWTMTMRERRQNEVLKRVREREAMEMEQKEEDERIRMKEEHELEDLNGAIQDEVGEQTERNESQELPSMSGSF